MGRRDGLAGGEHDGHRSAGLTSAGRGGAALSFRLLFVGDVVGPAGCAAVVDLVPRLREALNLDAVVANAENSAPTGRGITRESGSALLSVADFLTLGNHAIAALRENGADLVLVDSHAEATSEKLALAHYLDGRAQAVLGTHTHVPTADLSLLPGGTAYVTDVGMTGCRDSIIGFERDDFLALFLGGWRGISVATHGPVVFNAALVEFDAGQAVGVEAVRKEWKP